jgi:hypothetical protein
MNDAIDILKLYSLGSANGWNEFLTKSLKNQNISALMTVMRGLQVGMADLEKKKLNDEKINVFYCRLIGSIESTLRKILKAKEPSPLDNSLIAKDHKSHKELKKVRDQEFEKYLRKKSY